MTTFNVWTFGIALVGAVLGIINTWFVYDKDQRIKLKVIPQEAFPIGGAERMFPAKMLAIEVINFSSFSVTISEVGFLLSGSINRLVLNPLLIDGGSFPRRLEPRSSFTSYCAYPTEETKGKYKNIRCAYAKTVCGKIVRGNAAALKALIKQINSTG